MSVMLRLASAALGRPSKSQKPSPRHTNCLDGSGALQPRHRMRLGECIPYVIPPRDDSCGQNPSGSRGSTLASSSSLNVQEGASGESYCEICNDYLSSETVLYHHRRDVHPEAPLLGLCPICSVVCSVSEHLESAALHRYYQSSPMEELIIGEDVWPRPCFECDARLGSFQEKKRHSSIIKEHNKVIRERQAESAATEWQHFCWPCDQCFASEIDLTEHHFECKSRLRYMTRMEGELLSAVERTTELWECPDTAATVATANDTERDQSDLRTGEGSNPSALPFLLQEQVDVTSEERQSGLPHHPLVGPSSRTLRPESPPLPTIPTTAPVVCCLSRPNRSTDPQHPVQLGPREINPVQQALAPSPQPLPEMSSRYLMLLERHGLNETDLESLREREIPPSYLATILRDIPPPPPIPARSAPGPPRITPFIPSPNVSSNVRPLPIPNHQRPRVGVNCSSSIPSATRVRYNCPLCLKRERDWRCTPCGHVFCTSCIMGFLETDPHCPLCGSPAEGADTRKVLLNT